MRLVLDNVKVMVARIAAVVLLWLSGWFIRNY